jgi:superoxide dismutase, Cu-Zn family
MKSLLRLSVVITIASIFLYLYFSSEDVEMQTAVAVLDTPKVQGEVVFVQKSKGVEIQCAFTRLPPGKHGFHIHKAGDLRGEGCKAACDHWHKGKPTTHGGPPSYKGPRHTGDLGNIELPNDGSSLRTDYFLKSVTLWDLLGRSVIVHDDEDDYGEGGHEDSKTTGHSGSRIACAVIGRGMGCSANPTRKVSSK